MKRSFVWAILSLVALVLGWICADIVQRELSVRRAIATLDRAAWRRRFQDALADAMTTG